MALGSAAWLAAGGALGVALALALRRRAMHRQHQAPAPSASPDPSVVYANRPAPTAPELARITAALRPLKIGFLVSPKKAEALYRPFAAFASAHGVAISLVQTKTVQGGASGPPLDVLVQKAWDADSERLVRSIEAMDGPSPKTLVLDSMDAVLRARDRMTHLGGLAGPAPAAGLAPPFGVPRFAHLDAAPANAADAAAWLRAEGMSPPVVFKGDAGHDNICLVYGGRGLAEVSPPGVVQQFVPHGGILYKVYVLGRDVIVTTRASLPAPELWDGDAPDNWYFGRVSSVPPPVAEEKGGKMAGKRKGRGRPEAEEFFALSAEVRRLMGGMALFNYDVIVADDDDDEEAGAGAGASGSKGGSNRVGGSGALIAGNAGGVGGVAGVGCGTGMAGGGGGGCDSGTGEGEGKDRGGGKQRLLVVDVNPFPSYKLIDDVHARLLRFIHESTES